MKHELTQEEILVEIKDILSEYVEITRPLTPADRLIDDLGLDSFLIVYLSQRSKTASRSIFRKRILSSLSRSRISANGFSWK